MKTPHKHAALIKAWADGAEIEVWNIDLERWVTTQSPQWFHESAYRIKPEPKPDVVVEECVLYSRQCGAFFDDLTNNLRLTFDGETGKLKKAEVIE